MVCLEALTNENLGQGPSGKGPKSKAALLPSELRLLGVVPGLATKFGTYIDHGEEAKKAMWCRAFWRKARRIEYGSSVCTLIS